MSEVPEITRFQGTRDLSKVQAGPVADAVVTIATSGTVGVAIKQAAEVAKTHIRERGKTERERIRHDDNG